MSEHVSSGSSEPGESADITVSGVLDPVEGLPDFNLAAFLIPPIWGVAHGQWQAVFFLPAWAFADNVIRGPQPLGAWTALIGWSMLAATVALQFVFGRVANRVAWRRYRDRISMDSYVSRQRVWAVIGVMTVVGATAWIVAYNAIN